MCTKLYKISYNCKSCELFLHIVWVGVSNIDSPKAKSFLKNC